MTFDDFEKTKWYSHLKMKQSKRSKSKKVAFVFRFEFKKKYHQQSKVGSVWFFWLIWLFWSPKKKTSNLYFFRLKSERQKQPELCYVVESDQLIFHHHHINLWAKIGNDTHCWHSILLRLRSPHPHLLTIFSSLAHFCFLPCLFLHHPRHLHHLALIIFPTF